MNIFEFKPTNRNNISTLKRIINLLTAIANLTGATCSVPILNCFKIIKKN